jgi:hypothetical protein
MAKEKTGRCMYCGTITPSDFVVCFAKECLKKRKVDIASVGKYDDSPPKPEAKRCECCGRFFNKLYGDHKYCSHKCMLEGPSEQKGLKLDSGKQPWFAMPLEVLEPLADVYAAGEKKYAIFNCLQPFEDGDRRFWDAIMRHLKAAQMDPLAKDEETGCYHLAQVCFNALHRLHNARNHGNKT